MTKEAGLFSTRAADIRRAFDRSFAAALDPKTEEVEGILVFRVAEDRFAVRLREIAGLVKSGNLVPVPAKTRALLGLAGIRGELVPIFSTAKLLGYACHEEANWIFLCREPSRLGFAIGEFEGCRHLPKAAFSVPEGSLSSAGSPEYVVVGSCVHTIINVSNLVMSIKDP
ncbi:MAG: chemotaxis protein CheW [Planctomycetes bacterium]|nr:chemotaxis protein CheW [Planctomycetota bacterium]